MSWTKDNFETSLIISNNMKNKQDRYSRAGLEDRPEEIAVFEMLFVYNKTSSSVSLLRHSIM